MEGDLARTFCRRDYEVGLAEGPTAVKVHEVGDHRHQGAGTTALANRLMGDVVEQRVHRQHHVGIVLLEQLRHHLAYRRPEDRANRCKRGLRVARVVDGSPGGTRPPDHR